LEIFLPSKQLKKKVNKIKTNSQEIEEIKDPETCAVFSLYKHFATQEQQDELAATYRAGGMGWGFAKNALFEVLDAKFDEARTRYFSLLENPKEIDILLEKGADLARKVINKRINKVRKAVGFSPKKP
jgi:tryptophanyl-tRNA synthetase